MYILYIYQINEQTNVRRLSYHKNIVKTISFLPVPSRFVLEHTHTLIISRVKNTVSRYPKIGQRRSQIKLKNEFNESKRFQK